MSLFRLQPLPAYVEKAFFSSYVKADKLMLSLLFLQWTAATLLSSQTYGTYMYGFLSGGLLFLINLLLYQWYKGTELFRISVSASLMVFSIIFIQQQFGRIEVHFHVFIAMAILTVYKDALPIVIAAIVTIVHHILFNYLQLHDVQMFGMPVMVFNYGCGWEIVILHGFFVVIEAAVLIYIARIQAAQYSSLVTSEHRLKQTHEQLQEENEINKKLVKEHEQFAHALDESSIVSKTDVKGRITYVNEKFCEVSGYSRGELLGKSHNIVRHPDMPSAVFEELWKTIASKEIFKALILNKKKNGESYYVDTTIIPILDINDEIAEYIAIRYEVTELVNARDEARLAEMAKDNFLANMSHELRTPLNSIIGFTKMSRRRSKDMQIQKYMDVSLDSSYTLLNLINNILDVSKIQSGKFDIAVHPFELDENLEKLLRTFDPQCSKKSIYYENRIDSIKEVSVIGDWQRISQVITNLISNAVKFTPDNGHIQVEGRYENGVFTCRVSDSGIGLSEEDKKYIFEPFEQADVSTTREYGGTGLGLSISLELAEMMGGDISVESAEGKGSCFTLILPLKESTKEDSDKSNRDTYDIESIEEKRLSGRVLVAEDNKTNQMLIKLLLKDLGLTSDIANNGLEAIEMYREGRYDIILMDQNMPKMNGTEAMKKLRHEFADIVPIIALTSNVMIGDKEKFLEAGMDDYLAKPVDETILYAVLKKYLKA